MQLMQLQGQPEETGVGTLVSIKYFSVHYNHARERNYRDYSTHDDSGFRIHE